MAELVTTSAITKIRRLYPHVDEVKEWPAQQSIRMLWDRIHDLEERLQASERDVRNIVGATNAVNQKAGEALSKAKSAFSLAQAPGAGLSPRPGGDTGPGSIPPGVPPASGPGLGHVPTPPPTAIAGDLSNVTWIDLDVSGWASTAGLTVSFPTSNTIDLSYAPAAAWPSALPLGGTAPGDNLNANVWIFVYRQGWYAGTWDWLRPGQTTKDVSNLVDDSGIRGALANFRAVVGESYGFMVSGLARNAFRNVELRSDVVMATWTARGATTSGGG